MFAAQTPCPPGASGRAGGASGVSAPSGAARRGSGAAEARGAGAAERSAAAGRAGACPHRPRLRVRVGEGVVAAGLLSASAHCLESGPGLVGRQRGRIGFRGGWAGGGWPCTAGSHPEAWRVVCPFLGGVRSPRGKNRGISIVWPLPPSLRRGHSAAPRRGRAGRVWHGFCRVVSSAVSGRVLGGSPPGCGTPPPCPFAQPQPWQKKPAMAGAPRSRQGGCVSRSPPALRPRHSPPPSSALRAKSVPDPAGPAAPRRGAMPSP